LALARGMAKETVKVMATAMEMVRGRVMASVLRRP
jgi:hypothetical protein